MILNIESQTELSAFYVIYNRTIVNEKEGIYGISHLIEHLMSHNINEDLAEDFQNNGMAWNAYTSPTNIVFYLSGLDKYVNKFKYKFLNMLSSIDISEVDFELEKIVLLEEYTSIFNMKSSSHLLNLYRKLFGSYNTIGKKENIESISIETCKEHFKKYYNTPSKIINVSKHNPFLMELKLNGIENDYYLKYNFSPNIEFNKHKNILNKSSVIYMSPIIEDDWAVVFFINYLLSNGVNSPLYNSIRRKSGLAYYIRCSLDRLSDFSGVNIISTETDDDKVDKLIFIINETLNKIDFLTEERFEQVKNSIINKIETVDINRYSNVETYIKPKKWAIENNIYEITLTDVINTYLKYFNVENFYKSIDKKEFK